MVCVFAGIAGFVALLVSFILPEDKSKNVVYDREPSFILLYLRALKGALVKPRWLKDPKLPELQVSVRKAASIDSAKLLAFKRLVGWKRDVSDHVPLVYLVAETFRLCMAALTLPAFPVKVLGTVVNKKASYTLHRRVAFGERLSHSCQVSAETRLTPSGHLEFDVHLTSTASSTGDLVWSAVLTLVLMNPKPTRRTPRPEGGNGPTGAGTGSPFILLEALKLAADMGRRYAALDGDINPMHLSPWTSWLMGFKRPVANVHSVVGMVEARLAEREGGLGFFPPPSSLYVEFKKPVMVPTTLQLMVNPDSEFQVVSREGKEVMNGKVVIGQEKKE